ncbi:hypothetical protein [Thorsellia kenyensis]|uniref:Uncharacterized protein n=1 Tax=Thorsellia kenyensis TaxID=1549888 RepID=A0ABV6C7J3_9GAMM
MRADKSINPEVVDYLAPDTRERISCLKYESGQTSIVKLKKLNIGKDKVVDLTVK